MSQQIATAPLTAELAAARARTDELFALLSQPTLYERPIPDRHRLIFYLGHLDAFDWNQIARGILNIDAFAPEYDKLFEFGIDPDHGGGPAEDASAWPDAARVFAYCNRSRELLDNVIEEAPEQIVHVAIEHRLMHADTLAYLLHELPHQKKMPPETPLPASQGSAAPANPLLEIPAGIARMGQQPDEFGWDNEYSYHEVEVPAFRMSKSKITNGEYLEFVKAGAEPPHFWTQERGQWMYRGMFANIPLPLDWPVYVTQLEAASYARWRGYCLPTEQQFQLAAYSGPEPMPVDAGVNNYDFKHWDPIPVTAASSLDNDFGVCQLAGNGWEWTSTVFGPFPGFESFPFYPGYSKNFFDGKHYVLKGASPRTAAKLTRPSFRNWFRPDYSYVYSTFRLLSAD